MGTSGIFLGGLAGGLAERRASKQRDRQLDIQQETVDTKKQKAVSDRVRDVAENLSAQVEAFVENFPGTREELDRALPQFVGPLQKELDALTSQAGVPTTNLSRIAQATMTAGEGVALDVKKAGAIAAEQESARTGELRKRIEGGLVRDPNAPTPVAPSVSRDITLPLLKKVSEGIELTPAEKQALDLALKADPFDAIMRALSGGHAASNTGDGSRESPFRPTTVEDFNAIPDGAFFIDDDGLKVK